MRRNGLRIDIVLRDPVSGKVYRKKDSLVDTGIKEVYSFIAMKYQQEKRRTSGIINKEMSGQK